MALRDDNRAQLLLIGSVVVAVAILGTVVLLNIIHVPPDVNAQTDSQSVTSVERVDATLQDDLQQLSLMHTSVNETGEPLPYVDNSTFSEAVSRYTDAYNNLSTTTSPAIVSVEYDESSPTDGVVAVQNKSGPFPGPGELIASPDAVPFARLNITSFPTTSTTLRFKKSGPDESDIVFDDDEIRFIDSAGNRQVFDITSDEYAKITLIDGRGQIQSDVKTNRSLSLDLSDVTGVQFLNLGGGGGEFAIAGAGSPNCPSSSSSYSCVGEDSGETIDVNPTFHVVYQDANVAYETTFSAFGGDS